MGCKDSIRRTARYAAAALAAFAAGATAAPTGGPGPAVAAARAQYRAGDQFAAIASARGALAAYPYDPAVLLLNAQLARDVRGPAAALPMFRQAAIAAPKDLAVLTELAATMGEAGADRDMARVLDRIAELAPDNHAAAFVRAVTAARAGNDRLVQRLMAGVGDGPADGTPARRLLSGVLALRNDSPARAVAIFDRLAQAQPDNVVVTLLLARALVANGDDGEAGAGLRPLAEAPQASPYAITLLARALEHQGDRAAAAILLDRAAHPRPASLGVWPAALGTALDERGPRAVIGQIRQRAGEGDLDAALGLAHSLAARYPGSADIMRVLGDTQLLAGRADEALASYRRAGEVRSDRELARRIAWTQGDRSAPPARPPGNGAVARILIRIAPR